VVEVCPAYSEDAVRIEFFGESAALGKNLSARRSVRMPTRWAV
jgi:hypothetical protein